MPSLRSGYVYFDLGVHQDVQVEIGDGDAILVCVPVPFACTVKEIWACADVLSADGTLTVENAVGTIDTSLLSATCDIDGDLTVNVGKSLTLAGSAALRLAAGNMLRATWTLTDIDSADGLSCIVVVEPSTW
jgi:hypothetical protein